MFVIFLVDDRQHLNREKHCSILFVEYILDHVHCSIDDCTAHHDDMIWYVPYVRTSSSFYVGSGVSLHIMKTKLIKGL